MAEIFGKLWSALGLLGSSATVPPLNTYYPSRERMEPAQRAFYDDFIRAWVRGKPIAVEGNISYVFCLAYELTHKSDKKIAARELLALAEAYRAEPKIEQYCKGWAADCYVAVQDYQSALKVFPAIPIDSRASGATDTLLNLKLKVGAPLTGRDILTLFGPKVTKYARDHVTSLASYLDTHLGILAEREGPILLKWASDPATPQHDSHLFGGVPVLELGSKFKSYAFSYNPNIEAMCARLTRDAENTLREDGGLPRVGEGWIEETKLFYSLREHFAQIEVIQHARPDWLGNQHLDVFLPSMLVAVEYQGAQHDNPIAYFGGVDAFAKTKERDARKRRLCSKHGVHLIEVRPGYTLEALVAEILSRSALS